MHTRPKLARAINDTCIHCGGSLKGLSLESIAAMAVGAVLIRLSVIVEDGWSALKYDPVRSAFRKTPIRAIIRDPLQQIILVPFGVPDNEDTDDHHLFCGRVSDELIALEYDALEDPEGVFLHRDGAFDTMEELVAHFQELSQARRS